MANESEVVIVAKIGDMEGFKQANRVEQQEQLETFFPAKGRIRIRKTVSESGTDYVACIKTLSKPTDTVKSVDEIEEPSSSQFFEGFRMIAESLRVKTRYVFEGVKSSIVVADQSVQLPPVTYEVDVFTKPDGSLSEWCKIDIELNSFIEALKSMNLDMSGEVMEATIKVTHLPFKPQMAYMLGACTDEQVKASKELWETDWTQTPYGKPLREPQASVSNLTNDPQQPQEKQTEAENDDDDQRSV